MKGAADVQQIDPQQYAKVCSDNAQLREERDALKQELAWFKRQLFGRKSEKRLVEHADQLDLGQLLGDASPPSEPEPTKKITYTRRKGNGVTKMSPTAACASMRGWRSRPSNCRHRNCRVRTRISTK